MFHQKAPTYVVSASDHHASNPLHRGSRVESGLSPRRYSLEPSLLEDGGRGSVSVLEKKDKVIVTEMYVPADNVSADEEGEDGIRKNVQIEGYF